MTQTLTIPSVQYSPSYYGSYIELVVTRNDKFQNRYTIENDRQNFETWCIERGHATANHEPIELDDQEATSYDTEACTENSELLIDYCLEQIKRDFLCGK